MVFGFALTLVLPLTAVVMLWSVEKNAVDANDLRQSGAALGGECLARPTTILQIIPALDTGGAELSAVEIAEAVVRAGGRALIATEGGRLEKTAQDHGAEIVRFSAATKNPLRIVRNAYRLADLVRRENVDVVHARSRAPAWSALMAARRCSRPFVTTYHGAYSERGSLKRLYNSVMVRADKVIANSRFTADLIKQRYATPDDRIRVIYRGVDVQFERASVSEERVAAVRARWQVAADQRVVLQAARLTGWKGQATVIAAAGELAREGMPDDVIFVLAGDDQGRTDYRQRLMNQIEQNGLNGRVLLVGHEADMAAAFAASYVSIVASTEPEAFGRAASESQSMACPVIATRLGAPQETVLAGPDHDAANRTGWLVTPGDVTELSFCLSQAFALSDAQYRAMGQRGAQHVRTNFSLEVMKRQTLEVYDELLSTNLAASFRAFSDGSA